MTKFAFIRNDTLTKRSFNTRYTAARLQKQFKCKSVVEVTHDLVTAQNFSTIHVNLISQLFYNIYNIDDDLLPRADKILCDPKKLFMFSDDAEDTAFATDMLKEEVDILLFKMNTDGIRAFGKALDSYESANEALEGISDAEDMISRLRDYSNDHNLNLLHCDAEEDLEKLESDSTETREESLSIIEDALTSGW